MLVRGHKVEPLFARVSVKVLVTAKSYAFEGVENREHVFGRPGNIDGAGTQGGMPGEGGGPLLNLGPMVNVCSPGPYICSAGSGHANMRICAFNDMRTCAYAHIRGAASLGPMPI